MAKSKKAEPIIEDELVETAVNAKWDGHTSRAYRSNVVVTPEAAVENVQVTEDDEQEESEV